MKNFIKKITGIEKLEKQKAEAIAALAEAKANEEAAKKAEEDARRQEELAKMTPKERATELKEPWVAVLDTKVNPDNIRNGFFELDWNEYFIVQLKEAGYGFEGDPDEEIVDRWFQNVCRHVVMETWEQEQAIAKSFSNQYVQERDIGNGRREIS